MADETPKPDPPKPPATKLGFDRPITDPGAGKLPDHIHPETLMAKGVDPETKQIVAVNLAAMKAKYGEKKGFDIYTKVAIAGGFFDPRTEPVGSGFFPDLTIEGVDPERRAKIDSILNSATV